MAGDAVTFNDLDLMLYVPVLMKSVKILFWFEAQMILLYGIPICCNSKTLFEKCNSNIDGDQIRWWSESLRYWSYLSIESCKDVTKVSCRNTKIDAVPHPDSPLTDKIKISRAVIHNLRQQATPVY